MLINSSGIFMSLHSFVFVSMRPSDYDPNSHNVFVGRK